MDSHRKGTRKEGKHGLFCIRFKNRVSAYFFALVVVMFLTACSVDDFLVGRWELVDSYVIHDPGVPLVELGTLVTDTSLVYTFFSNRTGVMTLTEQGNIHEDSFEWRRTDGTLKLIFGFADAEFYYEFTEPYLRLFFSPGFFTTKAKNVRIFHRVVD